MSMLSIEEQHKLIVEWNDTVVDYPQNTCLHQLFEEQVEKMPDATALVFEDTQLNYHELNCRANQLARYLRTLGVGPEVLVGIFMERSIEMVISIYGILKAGGAYVPLDPEYPIDRVAYMIEDTQIPVLLTQKHLMSRLPKNTNQVVCLDSEWSTIAEMETDNLVNHATVENLAYVIFTSGSTGKPKGVMNEHRGICNRILWMQDEYSLTDEDCILQKTPFSFDVSVWEFFWPLLFGSKLVIARAGGHKDSSYLVRLIIDQGITVLHFVPSMLQIFLEEQDVRKCNSLKRVICSGEALTYDLQERFFETMDAELHNLYGPTEAAVDVTYWACKRSSDRRIVPIGRPVANTQMYVLDSHMQPLSVGVPGELHIGGVQVARGYLNLPELTADKFVKDPFNCKSGTRLYKTGDLACYLQDGALHYLGRIDNQVKIRGNRIELGEIESVLEGYPAVRQAVVIALEDESADKRLVAYFVVQLGQQCSANQIRLFLQEKLPDYMIPSSFVLLDMIPLSPNGKVDRRALPVPGSDRPELTQEFVSPRTEVERYLSSIWCEILTLDRIGINDPFFELGGSSLQAARFINRLQQELGENIYIVSIFESPSIAKYAKFLQKNYAKAVAKKLGLKATVDIELQPCKSDSPERMKIDERAVARMRGCIPTLLPWNGDESSETQNKSAIFILAPPRSGTTLLRVMLAGHPEIFSATELQLLGFNTLQERREAFSGKFSLWLEGTIRAIMEVKECDVDEAGRIMNEFEERNYTTKQFFRIIQDWIGNKILVDKSPSYVLDPKSLEKAERDFDNPLYIHVVRHPYAMVRSFVNYHMDQVLFLDDHSFSPQELAELVWLISNQNTLRFLQTVPTHRQHRILFEDLVTQPKTVMENLCQNFKMQFVSDLITPYQDIDKKMTNGIHEDSKPMGDTNFFNFQSIDSKIAESWKGVLKDNFLSDITWDIAASFGYELPGASGQDASAESQAVQKRVTGKRRDFFEQSRTRRRQRKQ